jgi:hypothetical protein
VDPTGPRPGLDISLRSAGDIVVSASHSVSDAGWTADLAMNANAGADVDFRLKPAFDASLPSGASNADVALSFALRRTTDAPVVLLGRTGGSRIEVTQLSADVAFTSHWEAGGAAASLIPALTAAIERGTLFLTGEGGDSLVDAALRGVDISVPFDLAASWSPQTGLAFTGGTGLTIQLPTYAKLGPIEVDQIVLALGIGDVGLRVDLAATISTELGPLAAQLRGLGLRTQLSFPAGGGNLGPAQLDLDFKPPTGVGLSLATSMITLGGFLDIDQAAHQYTGAVEIRLVDTFALTAIGIVNTRRPDGAEGFSMLFLIDTVFPTPIALGYNFYLAGVGGLLGLNRTVDLDRLRDGLRDGAASNVLFPTDVVANMSAIAAQVGAYFPAREGQFIAGPIARITWSSPPLIVIDLGLIIEFPSPVRIAVLGRLRAAVPDPSEPIVDIKVAFLGAIDFEIGLLSFDASIYDSYLGRGDFRYPFEGDIAVRMSWGKNKDLLSSVGGFHPSYHAPRFLHVPKLRPVSLSLLKDNPRLRLSSYFALTSNTVQFGAELDFYFKVSRFSVVGNFGFDALFQWDPFRFVASVQARLAVRAGGSDILSLRLAFELQGTSPWRAKGEASFGILFFTIKVRIDKTWGEQLDHTLPQVAVLPALLDELRRDERWTGALSATASQLVQVAPRALAAGGLVIDPAGVLEISQTLVPLGAALERFNNARPSDISSVDIKELRIGGTAVPAAGLRAVTEEFAPAAFRELSDADKLAAASYESMKGGIAAVGSDALITDYVLGRPVSYERIVDGGAPGAPPARTTTVSAAATFAPLVRGGAVGSSVLSRKAAVRREHGRVRAVVASEDRFSVVSTANLRVVDAQSQNLSRSQAQARLRALIAAGRRDDELDIIPAYRAAS